MFAEVDGCELKTCPSSTDMPISLIAVTHDWLANRPFLAPSDIAMSTDSHAPTSSGHLNSSPFLASQPNLAETRVESEKAIVQDASRRIKTHFQSLPYCLSCCGRPDRH